MKLCCMSDLHLDVNQNIEFNLSHDKDIFTIIAGDISGEAKFRDTWLKKQIESGYRGLFIEGNHIVYTYEQISLDERYKQLKHDYNKEFKFLENSCYYDKKENILFIGATLWTDFNLDKNQHFSMSAAELYMNDYQFKCIKTLKNKEYEKDNKIEAKNRWNDGIRKLQPQDTLNFFNKSLKYIQKTINKYKQKYDVKKIVIITHHAPCTLSISPMFKGQFTNSYYVSNLSNFILDNPEIKLWIHGHLHTPSDYMLGNCRVVCNPRGYTIYGENPNFNPNLIVEI